MPFGPDAYGQNSFAKDAVATFRGRASGRGFDDHRSRHGLALKGKHTDAGETALLKDEGLVDVFKKGGKFLFEMSHRRHILESHIDGKFPFLADCYMKAVEIEYGYAAF